MHIHLPHQRPVGPLDAPSNGVRTAAPVATPASTTVPAPVAVAVPRPTDQIAAAVAVLTGLWVAISPWFITMQTTRGANTTVNDLIIGLAVAGLCLLTMFSTLNVAGLQSLSLLAGVWLIISPFILDAKIPVTASMYWSNIWSGAIIIVVALAMLLSRSRA